MAVENRFSTVGKVLNAQVVMALAVAGVFYCIGGPKYVLSPLIGSTIAFLPNALFAYRIYLSRNLGAQKIVRAFYSGETIKLLITAALFSIVLKTVSVDFLTLLVGYAAVLLVFWFALFCWRD